MQRWVVMMVIVCELLRHGLGYSIQPCNQNTKQVEETNDAVFRCTGITHSAIAWKVILANGTPSNLGTCPADGDCNSTVDDLTLSRQQFNTSVLNVTGGHRTSIAGRLQCGGLMKGMLQERNLAECRITVVYASYNVSGVEVVVNRTDWTVYASSSVDKVYSSDGKYSCIWKYNLPKGGTTTVQGQTNQTSFKDNSGQQYRRLTCSFSGQPMPSEEGDHSYILTIDPKLKATDQHRAVLPIRSPSAPPTLLHCPVQVAEGGDLTCTCQAAHSEPPALVSWSDRAYAESDTATLHVNVVHRSQDGLLSYKCTQYWGGFDPQFAKETPYNVTVTAERQTEHRADSVPSILGGVLGASLLIIIIVVVVIVFKRRRRVRTDRGKPGKRPAEHDEDVVEHINTLYQSTDDPHSSEVKAPGGVALRTAGSRKRQAPPLPGSRATPSGHDTDHNYTTIPSGYFVSTGQPGIGHGLDRGATGQPPFAAELRSSEVPVPCGATVNARQSGTDSEEKQRQGRPPETDDFDDPLLPNKQTAQNCPEDVYNRLTFHRRPSPELPRNPDPEYNHLGAV